MSKKLKLSPWHSESTIPTRKGIYQIGAYLYGESYVYSYFDGKIWKGFVMPDMFPNKFFPKNSDNKIVGQDRKWRGILK